MNKRSSKQTIKTIWLKFVSLIINHPLTTAMFIIVGGLFVFLFSNFSEELFWRLDYELLEVAGSDAYLYYAVGHGMAEGLTPYLDMYENKPPMIFLLAKWSYIIRGDFYLANVSFFISMLVILIVPLIILVLLIKKNKTKPVLASLIMLAFLGLNVFYTMIAEDFAPEVQVETFGTACTVLSLLCAILTNYKNDSKFYSPQVIINGIFIGLAVMFKEPFALIVAITILPFVRTKKDLLYKFIVPIGYAIITAFLVLLLSGCVVPYFTIYIKNMFTSHLSIYGSPFKRMFNIDSLFRVMLGFSDSLGKVMKIMFICAIINGATIKYSNNNVTNFILKVLKALEPIVFLLVASFVVGLGGQYFWHHYVFAFAFYISITLSGFELLLKIKPKFKPYFILKSQIVADGIMVTVESDSLINRAEKDSEIVKDDNNNTSEQEEFLSVYVTESETQNSDNFIDEPKEKLIKKKESKFKYNLKNSLIYVVLIAVIFFQADGFNQMPQYDVQANWVITESYNTDAEAEYIDSILSLLGEERWQWIGFNGRYPYAHTKHLALGPCFVQDPNNFLSADSYFAMKFIKQLDEADVLVLQDDSIDTGILTILVQDYIKLYFTTVEPIAVREANLSKPESFNYPIYYKISEFDF